MIWRKFPNSLSFLFILFIFPMRLYCMNCRVKGPDQSINLFQAQFQTQKSKLFRKLISFQNPINEEIRLKRYGSE